MNKDSVLEDDNFDSLSCLKEELDIASICESGAEFEISGIQNNFEENADATNEEFQMFKGLHCDGMQSESFEDLAKDFFGITEDDLVMKQIVKHGAGPVVPPASNVVVHYVAYLEYADEPFDSTRMRKNAFAFDLGDSSIMEGFGIAVATMRRREMSKFLIGPEYAFGSGGCPPRIPKNATCLYIIELIDFKTIEDDAKPYFNLPMSQRNYASLDVVLKAFKSVKNRARDAFVGNNFHQAHKLFCQALKILVDYNKKDEEEENLLKPELIKLHVNVALCNLKLRYSARAIKHCNEALALDGENLRAHYFKGKALGQLGEFERSLKSLRRADSLAPGKQEIREELQKAEKYMNMFLSLNQQDRDPTGGRDEETYREVIRSKLNILSGDENLLELHLPSTHLFRDRMAFLRQESENRGLLLRTFKNNSGEEVIHLQKKNC